MTLICIKCNSAILEQILKYCERVILIADVWDNQFMDYKPELINRLYLKYDVKTLDSVEELSAIFVDLKTRGVQVDHALSAIEHGIFASGFINTLLFQNVQHINFAIATRDKRAMKSKFKELGIPCANFMTVSGETEANPELKQNLRYPLIAKPVCGLGSYNAEKIADKQELISYFSRSKPHPAIVSKQITVEEYIEGEEYHIDAIRRDNKSIFSIISKYIVPVIQVYKDPTLNGSCVIRPDEDQELYKTVNEMQEKLSQALGIENGITHTEFFYHHGKVIFSEIASRYAGAYIPEAIHESTGINIIDEWIRLETGMPSNIPGNNVEARNCGWINLSPLREGIIEKIPPEDELLRTPWIKKVRTRIKLGDNFKFDNPSNYSIFLAIEANSYSDFLEKAKLAHELFPIQVRTEHPELPGKATNHILKAK